MGLGEVNPKNPARFSIFRLEFSFDNLSIFRPHVRHAVGDRRPDLSSRRNAAESEITAAVHLAGTGRQWPCMAMWPGGTFVTARALPPSASAT